MAAAALGSHSCTPAPCTAPSAAPSTRAGRSGSTVAGGSLRISAATTPSSGTNDVGPMPGYSPPLKRPDGDSGVGYAVVESGGGAPPAAPTPLAGPARRHLSAHEERGAPTYPAGPSTYGGGEMALCEWR